MNELEFQEEWLSAYLDDELTEEQRQVVEQRLAIDPAAQATLEDLQRIRAMVAKLPSWSGPDLKFTIPAELPGSFDEAEDEFDDSNDTLDDFEEVPRSLALVDEPQVAAAPNANWNSHSRSTRSMLVWLASAASVLLVAGLGYLYWPTAGWQVALDSNNAPGISQEAEPGSLKLGRFSGLGRTDKSTDDVDALNGQMETDPAIGVEGRGGRRLGENTDPAPLAKRLNNDIQSASKALNAEVPFAADSKESKVKAESFSYSDRSPQMLSDGLGGIDRGGAKMDLALERLPVDAPVADLPPPSAFNSARSIAPPPENSSGVTADDYAPQNTLGDLNTNPAPAFFFARSQSWMEEEAQSSLQYGTYQFRTDQLAFGNKVPRAGGGQELHEVTTDGVLMVAIKPEISNSPEFFQSMITSNQLTAVEQRPALNQLFAAEQLQTADSRLTEEHESEKASRSAAVSQSTDAPAANSLSRQRFGLVMPNAPQGNSFVLFVNRDEASRILAQLQEKGQVASQVWRVVKQPEPQAASGRGLNLPAVSEPTDFVAGRNAGESLNRKAESASSDRVILMLNGPPN